MFYVHPENWEMIQFDEHIFSDGWFNHQLARLPLLLQQDIVKDFLHNLSKRKNKITKTNPTRCSLAFFSHTHLQLTAGNGLFFWRGDRWKTPKTYHGICE